MLARGKLSLHLGLAVGLVAGLAALGGASGSHAAEISIPNASFEAPAIRLPPYATATIQHWLKAPAPAWWLQEGYTQEDWLTTAGVFYNVPSSTYIDNVDGSRPPSCSPHPASNCTRTSPRPTKPARPTG